MKDILTDLRQFRLEEGLGLIVHKSSSYLPADNSRHLETSESPTKSKSFVVGAGSSPYKDLALATHKAIIETVSEENYSMEENPE